MNLTNIIIQIEDINDKTDRVIMHSNVIAYLNDLKGNIKFAEEKNSVKKFINDSILEDIHSEIERNINIFRKAIESNLK